MPSVKQFVEESLVQIAEGIQNAQERVRDMDVKFLPGAYSDGGKISEIEFDMAVTVTEGKTSSGEIGFGLAVISALIKGKAQDSKSEEYYTASRIRFTIQSILPAANKGENKPPQRQKKLGVIANGVKI
jgi:hypothetical protein